ncbi:MAG: IS1380 family transposase [Rhodococcus sp. (in: high G+C Gram-positive bacteria)]|uniref:IS1380 family transposase n=1 Tax=Nocardiaceae TaxID=85025 RepID=UPI000EF86C3E|nr:MULTISPECIES: IS1380 family transposase [Rhodococcus]MDN5547797.1 IS1380 family transposase [Rhodococcus sp. (in: high G+C Gram-positive bacteria)]MCZ4279039.1 IS1380 family transposase [Rhodococcus yunnanensis]RMB69721.1 IS1380 family transposase [Rhodococcus sp. SBT000017]RMB69785.1 IS1380 family transposase [Rhodococcus sp. SBT000017]RMB69791.1 IS1380 family transposase [Rhodococcus sp. SBT000017]
MSKSTSSYPTLSVDATGTGIVSHAGAVTLLRTAEVTGLSSELSAALMPWRKPLAQFDPGKIITDLAVSLALGGDCLADIATLREHTGVFGEVPSDATVSRLIATLAADAPAVLTAIDTARATARASAWKHAGKHAPDHDITADNPIVIDLDATLVTAHSDKELAAPTYKRGYGFHPLLAFVDHGQSGTGEPVAALLRAGNAGSNTAADHIDVTRAALAQLTFTNGSRPGKKVLVRTDGAGASHAYLSWLHKQRVSYSIGFGLTDAMVTALSEVPDDAWSVAVDAEEQVRDGAWVIDATGVLDLSTWPPGMRVVIRKERPHPGAQLRFTDTDGLRLTAFATNTVRGKVQDLELRHRRRARCEDRIRIAKDTGLSNLPLHGFDQNRIWLAIVALALELTAWTQMLGFTDHDARRWEPKRLRLRIFSIAGRIANHARRTHLRLSKDATWSDLIITALTRLAALPAPA